MDLFAAELYRYRDDKGQWVFTDRKPRAQEAEKQTLLITEPRTKVTVVNRGTAERPILYAVNALAGPVEVWLEFHRFENTRFSHSEPFQWIVDGPTEQFLLQIEQRDREQPWHYKMQPHYVLGLPVAPDELDKTPLGLPFRGGPFVLSQGFFGEASHSTRVDSHHAVDIAMPEGTPIVAVRSGIVMERENNFTRSGWEAEYANEANFVRVLHADGSMALYGHLAPRSVVVAVGETVGQGQLLARSGNTGFSSGPHLHFVMQINEGRRLVSVPFSFDGVPGAPRVGAPLKNVPNP